MTDYESKRSFWGSGSTFSKYNEGGADYTFDATGNVEVSTALESAHKGWGESIIMEYFAEWKFLLAHFSLLQVEYGRNSL